MNQKLSKRIAGTASSGRGRFFVWALAFCGAGVDVAVILGFNVLTAAQTGNTILFAAALARGDLATGFSAAVSVASYVAGAALGEWVLVRGPGRSVRGVLGVEIILLAGALLVWRVSGTAASYGAGVAVVALAALAMGTQSAAVRGLHAGATTTYITGVLTNFTTGLVEWLLPRHENPGSAGKPAEPPWRNGSVWVIYFAGAVFNGLLFLRLGELALLVPLAVLAILAGRVTTRPAGDKPD